MSIIIEKTFQFLDELENSQLITDLKYYKSKLLQNNHALNLIDQYNKLSDNLLKIKIKQELYQIFEYKKYMQLYNELSLIIFKINKKYSEYTNTKQCSSKL